MSLINKTIKRLKSHQKGSVSVELALAMPVMLICLAAIVEFGYFLLLVMKLQHTAVAVSDLVTRDDEITESTLADIFTAVPRIMAPYDNRESIKTIVTSINRDDDDDEIEVAWQREAGGFLAAESKYHDLETVTNLPPDLVLGEDETVITTEVFYDYEPLVFRMIPAQQLRRESFFRPRLGSLDEID